MGYENIDIEKKDHIGIITINHPPVNTWNLATIEEFEDAITKIEDDKSVRVVIITGSGEKCFSAGFDISDAGNTAKIAPIGRRLWRKLDRFTKPVIAAINGFALGGGLELALSCHFRIMVDAPKAKLGLTELNLGIIPGWGGTQRLTMVVGKAKALDMILFSKKIGALEALDMGLINQISTPEKLMDDTLEFAAKLAQRPPVAVSYVLKAISAGIYDGVDEGLEIEVEGTDAVGSTKDAAEGFTAFLEKRDPVFTGE